MHASIGYVVTPKQKNWNHWHKICFVVFFTYGYAWATPKIHIIFFFSVQIISVVLVLLVGIRDCYRYLCVMPRLIPILVHKCQKNAQQRRKKIHTVRNGNKPPEPKIKWKDKKLYVRKIGSVTVINSTNGSVKVQKIRAKRHTAKRKRRKNK